MAATDTAAPIGLTNDAPVATHPAVIAKESVTDDLIELVQEEEEEEAASVVPSSVVAYKLTLLLRLLLPLLLGYLFAVAEADDDEEAPSFMAFFNTTAVSSVEL